MCTAFVQLRWQLFRLCSCVMCICACISVINGALHACIASILHIPGNQDTLQTGHYRTSRHLEIYLDQIWCRLSSTCVKVQQHASLRSTTISVNGKPTLKHCSWCWGGKRPQSRVWRSFGHICACIKVVHTALALTSSSMHIQKYTSSRSITQTHCMDVYVEQTLWQLCWTHAKTHSNELA